VLHQQAGGGSPKHYFLACDDFSTGLAALTQPKKLLAHQPTATRIPALSASAMVLHVTDCDRKRKVLAQVLGFPFMF